MNKDFIITTTVAGLLIATCLLLLSVVTPASGHELVCDDVTTFDRAVSQRDIEIMFSYTSNVTGRTVQMLVEQEIWLLVERDEDFVCLTDTGNLPAQL